MEKSKNENLHEYMEHGVLLPQLNPPRRVRLNIWPKKLFPGEKDLDFPPLRSALSNLPYPDGNVEYLKFHGEFLNFTSISFDLSRGIWSNLVHFPNPNVK